MNALIIVAHGSRKKESALQVAALCKKVSEKCGNQFDEVEYAFLQFAEPLLTDKIEELIERGVKKIIIFPFFIAAGSHVLIDIPTLVEKAAQDYPGVEVSITRYLGIIESIEDLILSEVDSHCKKMG